MGIWTSNQPRDYYGKTFIMLEQNVDFQNSDFELWNNENAVCSNSEIRVLGDEMPILMAMNGFRSYNDPNNFGQKLTLITKLSRGGRDVEIDKIWGQGIGRKGGAQVQVGINAEPFWGLGYFEEQDRGGNADENFIRRTLKAQWQSNFGETLNDNWASDLQSQIFTYLLDKNLVNVASRSAQRELLYGRYWEDKAALMFKDRNFAVAAFKGVLGIGAADSTNSVPGATLYYHKSRLILKGKLYTTKDGNRKVSARYKNGARGGSDWTEICANAIFIYNAQPPTENDRFGGVGNPGLLVQNSFIIDLANPLQSSDSSYVEQDLFDALGGSIPAGVTSWYNTLCDRYEEWYDAWLKGEAKKWTPVDDYKAQGIQLGGWLNVGASTTSPGVLYLGTRFAFGKNNVDGSLWFGNWHFELTLNPRNYLSQAWAALGLGTLTSRNQFVNNIRQKTQTASSPVSKTPVGLDPNSPTSTNNGTRPGVGATDGPVPASGTGNGVTDGGHSLENKPGDQIRQNE